MEGIFGLDSDNKLLKKLEWEYENLSKDFKNPYVAYNFFVTAWHLLEWKYPDPKGAKTRKEIRDKFTLLQICEHIAIGAKHFSPTKKSLQSVKNTKKSGVWADNAWAPEAWADGAWATWLEVKLDGAAAAEYGEIIKVQELTELVMKFWRDYEN